MRTRKNPWTVEELKIEGAKYKSRIEFARSYPGAYYKCHRLGIMDEILPFKNTRWSRDKVLAECSNYTNRTEFNDVRRGAYAYAKRHGMLDLMPAKIGEGNVLRLSVPIAQIENTAHRVVCEYFLERMKRGDIVRKILKEHYFKRCSNKSTIYQILRKYTASILTKKA